MHKYKNTNNIYIALPDERVQCTLHYWIYTDTNTDTNINKTWSLKKTHNDAIWRPNLILWEEKIIM